MIAQLLLIAFTLLPHFIEASETERILFPKFPAIENQWQYKPYFAPYRSSSQIQHIQTQGLCSLQKHNNKFFWSSKTPHALYMVDAQSKSAQHWFEEESTVRTAFTPIPHGYIVSANDGKQLRRIYAPSGLTELIAINNQAGQYNALAYNTRAQRAIAGTEVGNIVVHNIILPLEKPIIWRDKEWSAITKVICHGIAVYSLGKHIKQWNIENPQSPIKRVSGESETVTCLSADGDTEHGYDERSGVLYGCDDGCVKIYDPIADKCRVLYQLASKAPVTAIAADDEYFYCTSPGADGIQIHDYKTGAFLDTIPFAQQVIDIAVLKTSENKRVVGAITNDTMEIYQIEK